MIFLLKTRVLKKMKRHDINFIIENDGKEGECTKMHYENN
jgi:hypothetical protein